MTKTLKKIPQILNNFLFQGKKNTNFLFQISYPKHTGISKNKKQNAIQESFLNHLFMK